MKWMKKYTYLGKYKLVSTNQHGERYKHAGTTKISVCNMQADITDANDITKLILLSDHLDCPVRYDFDNNTASIDVVGKEQLK